jgi:two-component system, chemotaxis family, protein-glutamate methylesterase/glutaminase
VTEAERPEIVAIGASAGGVEALTSLFGALTKPLPVPVLVVLHVPADGVSMLPRILSAAGPMIASHAQQGERVAPGRIYVAPPDRHMLVRDHRLLLTLGPRENGHRPAVDPMFRSVSEQFGSRAIGVVLSGTRDDGTEGLHRLKRAGGIALVQEPKEAIFEWMPRSALENVPVDRCAAVAELAREIESLVTTGGPTTTTATEAGESMSDAHDRIQIEDAPTGADAVRCPDCGGVMKERVEGDVVRYVCRVGHASTAETLFAQQGEAIEQALWAAINALEERAALARRMASRRNARSVEVQRYTGQATQLEQQAELIRDLLQGRLIQPPPNAQ